MTERIAEKLQDNDGEMNEIASEVANILYNTPKSIRIYSENEMPDTLRLQFQGVLRIICPYINFPWRKDDGNGYLFLQKP